MKATDLKPEFFQFGNKGDVWSNNTHIAKNGHFHTTLCGKPMLSFNYANNELHETIGCEKCLELYKAETEPAPVVKTAKEKLIEHLEYFSDEQHEELLTLLGMFGNRFDSKGALMKYLYGEHYVGIDSALPEPWVRKVQEIHPGFNTSFHCMNYKEYHFGKVENIAESIIVKIAKTFEL